MLAKGWQVETRLAGLLPKTNWHADVLIAVRTHEPHPPSGHLRIIKGLAEVLHGSEAYVPAAEPFDPFGLGLRQEHGPQVVDKGLLVGTRALLAEGDEVRTTEFIQQIADELEFLGTEHYVPVVLRPVDVVERPAAATVLQGIAPFDVCVI